MLGKYGSPAVRAARRYGPAVHVASSPAEGLRSLLGVPVHDLVRLSGGASRETWRFRAGDHQLVVQRRRRGGIASGLKPAAEAAVLALAATAGVPAPAVVAASDDPEPLGGPWVVMEAVPGEALPRLLLREQRFAAARAALVPEIATAAARLHRADPSAAAAWLTAADPVTGLREVADLIGGVGPALELGLRWIETHRPPAPSRPVVVHGDLRLGNLLVTEEPGERGHLAAVLDWELAHLGDPAEDLGWLCVRAWRFGSPEPVAGIGARDALLAAYADAGGEVIDRERLHWWEVYGTVRWGVICLAQGAAHLHGLTRSHELAAVGRRVAQVEHDLLLLVGGEQPTPVPVDPAEIVQRERPTPPHDRPSAAELIDAVREWLADEVVPAHEGRLRFDARVAAGALAVAGRELALGPAHGARHATRLATLGVTDDEALATAIRAGDVDDADRWGAVARAVWESVLDKLAVVDPGYADRDEEADDADPGT